MDNPPVAIEQKEIDFYGDEVTAVRLEDGQVYASLRHMCNALELNARGQRQRVDRTDILAEGLMVCITHTIKGARPTTVLRADLVPLWLAGVATKRLAPDKRDKLIRFQREASKVLWEAFQDGRLTTTDEIDMDALADAGNASAQAYVMARAIMRLSYQQVAMEQQLQAYQQHTDGRLDALETAVTQLTAPERHITDAQASQLSQAVKTVAMILSKQTRRNEYGGVYGELYRRYNITSYKSLPNTQFSDAMTWLNEWREMLETETF
ncbi:MAG: phage antirepressor N-terminal domain-containing protein [Chloroflexota bacterium]